MLQNKTGVSKGYAPGNGRGMMCVVAGQGNGGSVG